MEGEVCACARSWWAVWEAAVCMVAVNARGWCDARGRVVFACGSSGVRLCVCRNGTLRSAVAARVHVLWRVHLQSAVACCVWSVKKLHLTLQILFS